MMGSKAHWQRRERKGFWDLVMVGPLGGISSNSENRSGCQNRTAYLSSESGATAAHPVLGVSGLLGRIKIQFFNQFRSS